MFTLDDIYKYLQPVGVGIGKVGEYGSPPKVEDLTTVLHNVILSPSGEGSTFTSIKKKVDDHFTSDPSESGKKEAADIYKTSYYAISNSSSPSTVIDFGGSKTYWETSPNLSLPGDKKDVQPLVSIASAQEIVETGAEGDPKKLLFSTFVIKDAYVSPSLRGTKQIGFFLNSTPSLVASQMMPYLDVEFWISRDLSNDNSLNVPSQLRFLLGSRPRESFASDADKFLFDSTFARNSTDPMGVMGMEMFLSPQTLGDADDEGLQFRAAPPKKFVPFASIEGFEVKIQNAGAGKFASKRASLKFRIHDKARLAEFSEFIRGPKGFRRAKIWTTYGWLAPNNRRNTDGFDDDYFKFINENMLVRDCWQVNNNSMTFDQTGQLLFSLDLYSVAQKSLDSVTLTGDKVYADLVQNLQKAMEDLTALKAKYLSEEAFSNDATIVQVLESATTTGAFSNIKKENIARSLNAIKAAIIAGGATPEETKELESAIKELGSGGEGYGYDSLSGAAAQTAKSFITKLCSGPDPFLPYAGREEFFKNVDIIPLVMEQITNIQTARKSGAKTTSGKSDTALVDLGVGTPSVVSFGKAFMNAVVPAVQSAGQVDELQVIFYQLNDSCGPMSGMSIAEFPIHLDPLAQQYNDLLKTSNTTEMSLQTFLALLAEAVVDVRAIGYGMTSFYKPFDRTKPRAAEQPEKADAVQAQRLEAWYRKYKELKLPAIEMYVEVCGEVEDPGTGGTSAVSRSLVERLKDGEHMASNPDTGVPKKSIMRVHVYDKQLNPYKVMQSIFAEADGTVKVGQLPESAIRETLNQEVSNLKKKDEKAYQKLVSDLNAAGLTSDQRGERLQEAFPDALKQPQLQPKTNGQHISLKLTPPTPGAKLSVKNLISGFVPTLVPGSAGSLIQTVSVASKTDGAAAAMNLAAAYKNTNGGKANLAADGMSEASGLPLRVVPMQVTMTTAGVPTAGLYQSYFIDFGTGTTIDNIYICSSLTHSLSPGKFSTQWTFVYSDGYAKYTAPPTVALLVNGQAEAIVAEYNAAVAEKEEKNKKSAAIAAAKKAAAGETKSP